MEMSYQMVMYPSNGCDNRSCDVYIFKVQVNGQLNFNYMLMNFEFNNELLSYEYGL